jgi:hypothetical protein
MNVKRLASWLAAIVVSVAGLGLATAGPAAAEDIVQEPGRWVAYGKTTPIRPPSTWSCNDNVPFDSYVLAQVCAIRTADEKFVQAAVIIRNNRSTLYGVEVAMRLRPDIPGVEFKFRWVCPRSGVASGTWSVCFGRTLEWPLQSHTQVKTFNAGANGQVLGESFWV